MKKNTTLLLFLSLALSGLLSPASAEERSFQDIKRIAERLIAPAAVTRSIATGKATPEIKKITATKAYTVMGYEEGGFAIIANDDANSPVVGYSTDNAFSAENPALSWYLSVAEIKLNNHIMSAPRRAGGKNAGVPSDCKKSVPHMVKAKWDQGKPYNEFCPKAEKGKCVTGCVATAMAQIINYHRYPEKGIGTNYVWYNNNSQKLTVDYSATTYDYDNQVVPSYKGAIGITPEKKKAIATLMYHCGVAAKMQYAYDVSGAYLFDAADGLRDNFGYIVKYYGYKDFPTPDNYDDAKWCEVIYRELSAGNPVMYAGGSNYNGTDSYHCFVLDGYDERGYVGVNWGWSGDGDGYFSLDVMGCQIGNWREEFKMGNDMVIMHRPDQGDIKYDLYPATGIEDITAEKANEASPKRIYDAAGRLIGSNAARNHKGLIIERHNGKVRKVVR